MKTLYTPEKLAHDAEMIATFRQKQALPYEQKILHAKKRAWEFYDELDGNVHVSVGGLDSITLLLFLRKIGINCPAISCSNLEDKSIQRIHKALHIKCLPSAKTKVAVIKEFGYPILSKETANKIHLLQNPTEKNATVRHAIITGETGEYGGYRKNTRMKMSQKWLEKFGGADPEGAALGYQAAPFLVSDKCCYYLKEKPCDDYAKENNSSPYLGLMASEHGRREKVLMTTGCNYYGKDHKRSAPFAIFSRTDLLRLALEMDADWQSGGREEQYKLGVSEGWWNTDDEMPESIIPEIYGNIEQDANGDLFTTGAQRTGCSMCGFGVHLEKRPHRFDKLRERNEIEWHFWMYDMSWGEVLTYCGIEWEDKYAEGEIPGQTSLF